MGAEIEIMGNQWIKRFDYENSKWTDKECKRHKHDFSEKAVIHLVGEDESRHLGDEYYIADKCRLCRSFKNAELVSDKNDCKGIAVYDYINPHFAIGFRDIKPK